MPGNATGHSCSKEAVAEMLHVQVDLARMRQFVQRGKAAHRFFSTLEGYAGMDLFFLGETRIVVLIRWRDHHLFDKLLPRILHAQPVTDWLRHASGLTHQPAIIESFSPDQ